MITTIELRKMMPNKTSELRRYYLQQSQYSVTPPQPYQPPLIHWPRTGYFDRFDPDTKLLEKSLHPEPAQDSHSIAEQVFGNQQRQEYTSLKHLAHLLRERAELHRQHICDIDQRHIEIQEKLFGIKINNTPDKAKRQSGLESQILQLEQQRRDEELAFWKDTVELREKLFEGASTYAAAKHRYAVFSRVEDQHD